MAKPYRSWGKGLGQTGRFPWTKSEMKGWRAWQSSGPQGGSQLVVGESPDAPPPLLIAPPGELLGTPGQGVARTTPESPSTPLGRGRSPAHGGERIQKRLPKFPAHPGSSRSAHSKPRARCRPQAPPRPQPQPVRRWRHLQTPVAGTPAQLSPLTPAPQLRCSPRSLGGAPGGPTSTPARGLHLALRRMPEPVIASDKDHRQRGFSAPKKRASPAPQHPAGVPAAPRAAGSRAAR